MDVLDHSCSKLGFGGKMCIDGTFKFEEEIEDNYQYSIINTQFSMENLKAGFSEIKLVNASLLKKEIPVLIISVEKNRPGHIKELHHQICALPETAGIKMILYVEHTVDANDLPTALWRFCNNLDPKRDHHLCKRSASNIELQHPTSTQPVWALTAPERQKSLMTSTATGRISLSLMTTQLRQSMKNGIS